MPPLRRLTAKDQPRVEAFVGERHRQLGGRRSRLAKKSPATASDRFWLNLQTRFDLEVEKDRLGESLETQVEVLARAG